MFMETCAMPRSSSMKPMALQLRKPPKAKDFDCKKQVMEYHLIDME